jgi:hypothetical protein
VARSLRLLGRNRRNILEFRDSDHWPVPATDLRATVLEHVRAEGEDPTGWRITLVTNLRFLGYVFNPASFYLCRGTAGELRVVIVEVHDTHLERHDMVDDTMKIPGLAGSLRQASCDRWTMDVEQYVLMRAHILEIDFPSGRACRLGPGSWPRRRRCRAWMPGTSCGSATMLTSCSLAARLALTSRISSLGRGLREGRLVDSGRLPQGGRDFTRTDLGEAVERIALGPTWPARRPWTRSGRRSGSSTAASPARSTTEAAWPRPSSRTGKVDTKKPLS